jgi:hypothetical protein
LATSKRRRKRTRTELVIDDERNGHPECRTGADHIERRRTAAFPIRNLETDSLAGAGRPSEIAADANEYLHYQTPREDVGLSD